MNATSPAADPSVPEELHLYTLGGYVVATLLTSLLAHGARRAFERGARDRERARKEAWVSDAIAAMRVISLVFAFAAGSDALSTPPPQRAVVSSRRAAIGTGLSLAVALSPAAR